jgi:RNA polymerase sigma-70 factor (ECF subfamily)
MTRRYGSGLERWELAITTELVVRFRRRSRSLEHETLDDLVQECLTHWILARRKLDPDPGGPPLAYLKRVIHNKLLDLAHEREAQKRHGDLDTVSLDQPLGDAEDAPTLADLLDANVGERGGHDDPVSAHDARIDLARAMAKLNDSQRRLCHLLGEEGLSIKEAAQRLGIPRGTLYEEIKRIRKVFAEIGLGDYLKP